MFGEQVRATNAKLGTLPSKSFEEEQSAIGIYRVQHPRVFFPKYLCKTIIRTSKEKKRTNYRRRQIKYFFPFTFAIIFVISYLHPYTSSDKNLKAWTSGASRHERIRKDPGSMDFPRIFNRGWKVFEAGFYRKETRLFYTRGLLLRYHERRRSPSFRKFQRARLLLKYEKLGPEKLMEARIIISKSIRSDINRSDQFPFISIHRNCAIHFSENRRKKEKRERMDGKRVSEKIGGEKIKIALNVSS